MSNSAFDPCCDSAKGNDGWDWLVLDCFDQYQTHQIADWQVKSGDLVDLNQLHSAVVIQLFTDRRVPEKSPVLTDKYDHRGGWWGDYFHSFEMGSHLWTLYRSYLTDGVIDDIKAYTKDAMKKLLDQGAAARMDISFDIDKTKGFVGIIVNFYAKDGTNIYKSQFKRFWND